MPFLKSLFGGGEAEDNLRIIITRHGERADLALGPDWSRTLLRHGRRDPRLSHVTARGDINEWDADPPLTAKGEKQSISIGRKLLKLGYPIDYCYASPAYRTIQTATKILEGQHRKVVPINIEPGLFECPSWYGTESLSFIPPTYLARDPHFNVNASYDPIYPNVDHRENEASYYERSRRLIDKIIKQHRHQGGTILLSGHAGSIETITRGMLGRAARPEYLPQAASKVDYCNFAILERDAHTRQWFVHSPFKTEFVHGYPSGLQSSIPLYSPTSIYLPTKHHTSRHTHSRNSLRGDQLYLGYFRYK